MGDHLDKKQQELKEIQDELQTKGLSRRKFLNRLQAVGVGFGAAFVLGVNNADARGNAEAGLNVASTNPALDDIIAEGRDSGVDVSPDGAVDADGNPVQLAQYGRGYYRGYRRGYARYARGYARYARGYARYARYYQRYNRYARGYARYARGYRRGYSRYY
jgi:hypothetical protein